MQSSCFSIPRTTRTATICSSCVASRAWAWCLDGAARDNSVAVVAGLAR